MADMTGADFSAQIKAQLGEIGLSVAEALAAGVEETNKLLEELARRDQLIKSEQRPPSAEAIVAWSPALSPFYQAQPLPNSTNISVSSAATATAAVGDNETAHSIVNAVVPSPTDSTNQGLTSNNEKAENSRFTLSATSGTARATDAYANGLSIGSDTSSNSNYNAVLTTMVIGAGSPYYVAGSTQQADNTRTSLNVIQDSIALTTQQIPGDTSAAAAMIAAIWGNVALYQATLLTVGTADQSDPGKKVDVTFAQNYSDRLIKLCSDQNFNNYLLNLITQNMEGTEQANDQQKQAWVNQVKIGLLLSALALFNLAIPLPMPPGQEVSLGTATVALLKGTTSLPDSDPRKPLIEEIKKLLASISDPAVKEALLNNIMESIDSAKSAKALTDPLRVMLGVLMPNLVQGKVHLSKAA